MGHGHGHSHRAGDELELVVARGPRTALLVALVLAGIAALVGMVLLWPDGDRAGELQGSVGFAAEGVTFPDAVVVEVEPACSTSTPGGTREDCGRIGTVVDDGVDEGRRVSVQVPPEVSGAGLGPGDRLQLIRTPSAEGQPATLNYFGIERGGSLRLLLIVLVVVVLAVARLRGLFALLGLGFATAVVGWFVLPALLTGESAVPVAVVGATVIMYVVLYTTHGFSIRTSTALAGTLGGLLVTAAVGWWSVRSAHLSGVSDETGGILTAYVGGLDFQGLLQAAIIIAGLGVLNDVTITQASAVWELRGASPEMSRRRAFTSAMRIGRDHIASTIYTIVFAYAGTALTLVLVLQLYDRPVLSLIGTEEISEEVVRAIASTIGLVLAVPITTAIAALMVPASSPEGESPGGQTRH